MDFDLEMLESTGMCKGIENYARYLTGQNASVQLQKGECRRMFWIPEKDDSKLKVTLTEKACVSVME